MVDKILLARLFALIAFACGAIGLVASLVEREWRLGNTGWFEGGLLVALLALVILIDEYVTSRRSGDS